MTADPVAFGRRVRELRRTAGLTPAQAAQRAGITAAYWSVIEGAAPQGRNERASLPRIPVVRALADAVDADKAELLDLAGYTDHADVERARVERVRVSGDQAVPGAYVALEALRLHAPDLHAAVEHVLGALAATVTPES